MTDFKNYKRKSTTISKDSLAKLKLLLKNDVALGEKNIKKIGYIPLSDETQKLYYEVFQYLFRTPNETRDWLYKHKYCILRIGRHTPELGIFLRGHDS